MKKEDKEFCVLFTVAFFVSIVFYLSNLNSVSPFPHKYYGIVMYDIYWIYFGIAIPFVFPVGYMIKKNLGVGRNRQPS